MVSESVTEKARWTIRKYADDRAYAAGEPYEVSEFHGNCLLNEGILALQNLLTGGTETAYNNTNSYLGVGESATAADPAQTGLLGATVLYKAMEATYPTIVGSKTTWRSVFGSSDANWAWNEFSVSNSSGGNTGDNLNRKMSAQGTKASGQTWTLDLEITWT